MPSAIRQQAGSYKVSRAFDVSLRQAVDATHRQLQQDAQIRRVTIPHLTEALLVDQRTGL
ncbi:hypothetical protein D3C83_253330 [compost metagenome]